MRWLVLMAAVAAGPAMALAPACPVPPELAGWTAREPVTAGRDTALTVGRAADLALAPSAQVAYRAPPEKPGAAGTFGGTATFAVPRAGIYRVALGAGAWIDVLEAGRPVVSGAHGHGPACSTIRKMVDFTLRPGTHVLQVAGSPSATLAVMIAPRP